MHWGLITLINSRTVFRLKRTSSFKRDGVGPCNGRWDLKGVGVVLQNERPPDLCMQIADTLPLEQV